MSTMMEKMFGLGADLPEESEINVEDEFIKKITEGDLPLEESSLSINDLKTFYNTSDTIDKDKYPNFFEWYDYMVRSGKYHNESVEEDGKEDKKDKILNEEDPKESLGYDINEYQEWVDYDMKHYGKISDETNQKLNDAGLEVVKDDHGDYEVIAKDHKELGESSLDSIKKKFFSDNTPAGHLWKAVDLTDDEMSLLGHAGYKQMNDGTKHSYVQLTDDEYNDIFDESLNESTKGQFIFDGISFSSEKLRDIFRTCVRGIEDPSGPDYNEPVYLQDIIEQLSCAMSDYVKRLSQPEYDEVIINLAKRYNLFNELKAFYDKRGMTLKEDTMLNNNKGYKFEENVDELAEIRLYNIIKYDNGRCVMVSGLPGDHDEIEISCEDADRLIKTYHYKYDEFLSKPGFDYYENIGPFESIQEDTIKKRNGKWTNRGDDGKEHGEFKTKKAADAQRKAMFANGYKAESLTEEKHPLKIEIPKILFYGYLGDMEYDDGSVMSPDEVKSAGFKVKDQRVYLPAGIYEAEWFKGKGAPAGFDFKMKDGQWYPFVSNSRNEEGTVYKIIGKKYEESFKLSLKEDVEETLPGPDDAEDLSLSNMISKGIKDEYNTIELYNSIALIAREQGRDDIADLIDNINTEENNHVGMLQSALRTLSKNADAIESGDEEAKEYLGDSFKLEMKDEMTESLDEDSKKVFTIDYNTTTFNGDRFIDSIDIEAPSASKAIEEFTDSYMAEDDEIIDVYDESDIHYDTETGEELEEDFKLELKEAFNPNFPDWVLSYLRRVMKNRFPGSLPTVLKNKGIDLYAADFVEVDPPTSNRDPALKDTTRLALFDIVDDKGDHFMWTPAMSSDWGAIKVSSKEFPGSYDYKKPEDMSWKWILDHTANYGYFDLSNAETTARDKRASRADAKKGSIERGLGQYHHKKYGTEDEWRWLQSKGQDKSGYKLDPNKYSRMLDSVGLDNYADRLKSYYNKIEEVRSALVSIITDADLLKKDYRSKDHFSGNIIGDVHRAADYLSDAIENYKEIETSIDRRSSRGDLDDLMVSEIFKWNAPSLRRSLQDAVEYIKHMKSNPTYPKDED